MNTQTPNTTNQHIFTIYTEPLSGFDPSLSTLDWLWEQRLPLAGITLLDGDHGTGKSLFSLHCASRIASGTKWLDNTTTKPSGVIIVTPNIHATTTQIPRLQAMGANLPNIEILSYVPADTPNSTTPTYRPFSFPEDLTYLFEAVDRFNAKLIILDPFINLLSFNNRWTNARLAQFLFTFNQRLIERNIACLLVRNCPTKGGHARPSTLERSEYFLTTAASRLLLTHDPFHTDRFLLCHIKNEHGPLAPTLTLELEPSPSHYPNIPHFTSPGPHNLTARDFLDNRPDTLHRRLLAEHLKALITEANKPTPVAHLYSQCPNSSPYQVQRALNDLINMGQIERPARGFYGPAPANPIFRPDADADANPFLESSDDDDAVEEEHYQRMRLLLAAQNEAEAKAKARADKASTNPNEANLSPAARAFFRLMDEEYAAHPEKAAQEEEENAKFEAACAELANLPEHDYSQYEKYDNEDGNDGDDDDDDDDDDNDDDNDDDDAAQNLNSPAATTHTKRRSKR